MGTNEKEGRFRARPGTRSPDERGGRPRVPLREKLERAQREGRGTQLNKKDVDEVGRMVVEFEKGKGRRGREWRGKVIVEMLRDVMRKVEAVIDEVNGEVA